LSSDFKQEEYRRICTR